MSTHDNGGPAYPVNELSGDGSLYAQHLGMTLRDKFAETAMLGIYQMVAGRVHDVSRTNPEDVIARQAYAQADAMLKARAEQ